MSDQPAIAVTTGEPAGVGPELCARLGERNWPARIVLIGDRALLAERIAALGIQMSLRDYTPNAAPQAATLDTIHIPIAVPCVAGQLDAANSPHVLALLERAIAGCRSGEFAAMVTAPVHKGIINDAGIAFSGHTEYLAQKTGAPHVVMLLTGGGMRVALATTHLPLKDVAAALTAERLTATLCIIDHDLKQRFGIARPRILVAGLNPHAGEGGHLGREEIDVMIPVLNTLRNEGMQLIGPLPADTLFNPAQLSQGDCVLAMYHDQGLPC